MAYSNGYDLAAVNTSLASRVGFRQPLGSGVPVLSAPVIATDSGRYYQDFHSLVTVQNIKATMEQVNASDTDLNTYLTNFKKAAIQRCLNGVFTGPQIIDEGRIFRRYGLSDILVENTGLFIGYEIDVAETQDAGVQIDVLQLYFDSAVTFDVYLFKDGKLTEEWAQSVTTVANQVTDIALTDKVLSKGKYYLGYFQNDIGSAKAYREQVDYWNTSYYYCAKAVQCDSTGATTFDREQRSYTMQPVGFNAEISSFLDHTLQIKRKAAMFDELQGLTLAYMIIEQIIYSSRSNKDERIFKDQLDKVGIQLDLNGVAPISDSPQIMGLKQRIEREVQTVLKSFYKQPKSVIVSRC